MAPTESSRRSDDTNGSDDISMTRYGSTSASAAAAAAADGSAADGGGRRGGGRGGGGGPSSSSVVTFADLDDKADDVERSPTDPLLGGAGSSRRGDHRQQGHGKDASASELTRSVSWADSDSVDGSGGRLLGGGGGGGSSDGPSAAGEGEENGGDEDAASGKRSRSSRLRRLAIDLSLYVNLAILLTKLIAYARTLSLSVLAALTDSVLDVVSQMVLNYTERHSSLSRSSALYPAGASRLEPLGVLTCAALMGMASFEIIKESAESLIFDRDSIAVGDGDGDGMGEGMDSFWSMLAIVLVKLGLWALCLRAAKKKTAAAMKGDLSRHVVKVSDPTLEALAQDHWNDCLSNAVAAVALLFALSTPALWFLDPLGAVLISVYIIYSWYETGKEQIEQLTGKCAPDDFIDGMRDLAANFDDRMEVDVVRAYHFGPKFLVEIEVVLPRDTLLFESHDLGMALQYEIEAMEDVERCFVHIDYETRPYDEHVVSKVPELREKLRRQMSGTSLGCHSV